MPAAAWRAWCASSAQRSPWAKPKEWQTTWMLESYPFPFAKRMTNNLNAWKLPFSLCQKNDKQLECLKATPFPFQVEENNIVPLCKEKAQGAGTRRTCRRTAFRARIGATAPRIRARRNFRIRIPGAGSARWRVAGHGWTKRVETPKLENLFCLPISRFTPHCVLTILDVNIIGLLIFCKDAHNLSTIALDSRTWILVV